MTMTTEKLAELRERAKETLEALQRLIDGKRQAGGVHGQIVGIEPYIIKASGFDFQCLMDAQILLVEMLDPLRERDGGLIALAERALQSEEGQADLLPCPFCGSAADDFNPDGEHEGYRINCSGDSQFMRADSFSCPVHTFGYSTYEDAKTAWNRRASQLALPAGPVPEVDSVAVPAVLLKDLLEAFELHRAGARSDIYPLMGVLKQTLIDANFSRTSIRQSSPAVAQPVADERDAERLEWVSHAWGGQRHDYANHVLSRGGDGDLSDIRTFIDKHLPARAALCQPAEEGGKS